MSNNMNISMGKRVSIVVFACILGLMAGLIYTWSIWVQPICAEYGWATDQVALMGNVMLVAFVAGCTLGGQLLPRLGAKSSSIIGTILFGGFFFISSFVTNPAVMYVTYGVFAGLGVGVLYVVGQFAASAWFPDKRGLVMGIFLAIFGLSVTVFASPLNSMLGSMGVKATMRTVGIAIFVLCLVSSIFMSTPPAGWSPVAKAEGSDANASEVKDYSLNLSQAVKTPSFWFITLAYCLLVWPYSFISSYLAIFITEDKMLPATAAVTAVAVTGIGSFLGRFLGGLIVDKLGPKMTYLFMCLCSIIACLGFIVTNNATLLFVLIFILCFGYGGRTPVYGVIFGKQFGQKFASSIYGVATLSTAITLFISPLVTASTRNANGGSFTTACIIAAIVAAIGCTSMMLVPKISPLEKATYTK